MSPPFKGAAILPFQVGWSVMKIQLERSWTLRNLRIQDSRVFASWCFSMVGIRPVNVIEGENHQESEYERKSTSETQGTSHCLLFFDYPPFCHRHSINKKSHYLERFRESQRYEFFLAHLYSDPEKISRSHLSYVAIFRKISWVL